MIPVLPGIPVITFLVSPGRIVGLIQGTSSGLGDLGLNDHSFEDVISVRVVPGQVLELPDHLAGIRIDRERRVRVEQVGLSRAAQLLGRGAVTPVPRRPDSVPDRSSRASMPTSGAGLRAAIFPRCHLQARRAWPPCTRARVPRHAWYRAR